MDTACSSSLVTTHLAAKVPGHTVPLPPHAIFCVVVRSQAGCNVCFGTPSLISGDLCPACCLQGLERGECEAAGSVGVNLALVHSWTRACLRAGMLAEDGRCKTLDASAGSALGGRRGLLCWLLQARCRLRQCARVACMRNIRIQLQAMPQCPMPPCAPPVLFPPADGYVRAEAVGAVMLALVHPTDPPARRQGLSHAAEATAGDARGPGQAAGAAGGEQRLLALRRFCGCSCCQQPVPATTLPGIHCPQLMLLFSKAYCALLPSPAQRLLGRKARPWHGSPWLFWRAAR